MMMPVLQKAPFSGLLPFAVSRYSFAAVAKSAAGRRNPSETKATPDAPCVFFVSVLSCTHYLRTGFLAIAAFL
ncbi:TPA: ash family protein [Klebsiella pneumoniae]|nr:ash family protein [Klebsiella pneumoniae]